MEKTFNDDKAKAGAEWGWSVSMWQGKPLWPPLMQFCWKDHCTHWLEVTWPKLHLAICNLGKVNLKPMHPAVTLWSVVALRAYLAMHTCRWALVTIFAVVCSADLCGSVPWTDRCFGDHICSLLAAQLGFLDHFFGHFFCQLLGIFAGPQQPLMAPVPKFIGWEWV